ncbi:MAG: Rieske 2Fe-2S domain-containing protein [Deltaproteobacteria bacterium]|nr:Rieske 2Fe-2S domain-containing protein [Deltaproteobacteria bacterium]
MISREENEMLTRVGPGTPAGELLRRYWHPVAIAQELTEENPTKFVRILCENLVLFRDKKGRVGLIEDRCAHRGASLVYGRVEERGIACAYHGWLYDTEGNCLETPPEPAESNFRLTVKPKAYPVQKHVGLYWAYLGPAPAPVIPKYDVWARKDGTHWLRVLPRLDCNWFQAMENSVDTSHLHVLHANFLSHGKVVENTTRGSLDDLVKFECSELPYGIMKTRTFTDGEIEEHPLIFPNILRQSNRTQIRVPIDDIHTWVIYVHFVPNDNGSIVEEGDDLPIERKGPFKVPADGVHPFCRYTMDDVDAQDYMAWETQGPITDRTIEHLATSDRGVSMLREMFKREFDKMQRGLDPMNVIWDPDHAIIDTQLDKSMEGQRAGSAAYHIPEDRMRM